MQIKEDMLVVKMVVMVTVEVVLDMVWITELTEVEGQTKTFENLSKGGVQQLRKQVRVGGWLVYCLRM